MSDSVNFTHPDEDNVDTVELYEDGDYVATLRVSEVKDALGSIIEEGFGYISGPEDGFDYQKSLALRVLKAMLEDKIEELS